MNTITLMLVLGAALFYSAFLVTRFSHQIARLSNALIRMPASQKVVFALGMTIATVSAQKCGTTELAYSEAPQLMMILPPALAGTGVVASVCSNDVLRGYRLESVATNAAAAYAMPPGAAVRDTWHLTGAYQAVRKVALDG
ncbi:MAG: hypothetical protein ACI4RD_01415, partial [Kiritimatiellia bacterium]